MSVLNADTERKVPALSEIIGDFEPFMCEDKKGKRYAAEGLKVWKRPYSKAGDFERVVIASTETACELFQVSAQTLSTWAKEQPSIRVAYGWWSTAELCRWIQSKRLFDNRGGGRR